MLARLAREYAMNSRIDLIPVPCGLGGPDPGAAAGPEALRRAGLAAAMQQPGRPAEWQPALAPDPELPRWEALAAFCPRLADGVAASLIAGRQPWVIGGDHAIAAGTWRGVMYGSGGNFGLLWIDAHLDAHVPADSPTGNPHGMPLACLLGAGDGRIVSAALSRRYVCVLGARQWEEAEQERLRRFGVRIFDAAEIERRGLAACLADALKIVTAAPAGFGITLDLDVFDPAEAPGVATPAPGGRPAAEWLAALAGLAARPGCRAVEIVELDPARDPDGRTAQLAVQLAAALNTPAE